MNSQSTPGGGGSASSGRSPANIEITLFGFLISLTLKAALDTAYGSTLGGAASVGDLWRAVSVPASGLIIVFVITFLRFVYGAYRINDEVQNSPWQQAAFARFWNLIATLVLFVLFYATALSIRNERPFFTALLAIHAWDFVWLLSMALTSKIRGLPGVMWRFVVIDLVTVALLALLIFYFPDELRPWAIVLMIVLAVVDFWLNSKFFFHPADWRRESA